MTSQTMVKVPLPPARSAPPLLAYPKVQIRTDRVLYKNRDIRIFQRVCNLLDKERIRCSTRSEPHQIHSELETFIDMPLACHFRSDLESEFLLGSLHPSQSLRTYTLK